MKRRSLLKFTANSAVNGALVLLLGRHQIARGAGIVAVRVWPAADYTRITIESDVALKTRQTFIKEPPRLALDIEGLELSPALRELVAKVKSDDPFISGIRIGQFSSSLPVAGGTTGAASTAPNTPNIVRLVMDLKQAVLPQVFTLQPVAAYAHRLVLDLHPVNVVDPLEALIAERLKESTQRFEANKAATAATASSDPLGDLIAQKNSKTAITNIAPQADDTLATSQNDTKKEGQKEGLKEVFKDHLKENLKDPPKDIKPPKAAAASAPNPAVAPSKTDRLIIIALDPGHGGEDPGAVGPSGTREKDVVLSVALKLRDRINKSVIKGNPMRAYLTRDADFFVPLQDRVKKAQKVQADLFVSIHADAFSNPDANGASVFALSEKGATSASAKWLANKENAADAVGGVNIKAKDVQVLKALLDMSTTAQINDSMKLGGSVLREIGGLGRLHKPQVEQAGFAVLKAHDIPSVLIETAFISNPDEEEKLRSHDYQDQLADAVMRGIKRYFARNPPLARNRQV
jgi:N-acetylmuramoyl-L-alanine amidase